jgi:hypothetical protein
MLRHPVAFMELVTKVGNVTVVVAAVVEVVVV